MMKACANFTLISVFVISALVGCATKEPESRARVYWPPPPNEPKLEWITVYASDRDFPKTSKERMLDSMLGEQKFKRFGKPVNVVSSGDGKVIVADLDDAQLRLVDFNERTSRVFAEKLVLRGPLGLAMDSKGLLYLSDSFAKNLVAIDSSERVVKSFDVKGMKKPTFLALDEKRNRLYISDVLNHEVVVFDLDSGAKLFSFNGEDSGKGKLYTPQGIAIDSQGNVYVAEQLAARIHVFDADGNSLYYFGERTDKAYDFEGPRDLAIDSNDNLFVTDVRKGSLLVFTPKGEPLTYINTENPAHPMGFSMPSGIHIDQNDRIYIADGLNRRISIWQKLNPGYLKENPLDEKELERLLRISEGLKEEGVNE